MSRVHRRGPWVAEEDATLLSLVASRGPNNWVQISQHMHYRSPKQCRERYHQNLKASLNHDPISAKEGELIEQMVTEMGKKWAEIARRLGNRSDNAVKNWWNGSQNRRKRNVPHHGPSSKTLANRSQPLSSTRPPSSSGHPDVRHRNHGGQSARSSQAWPDLGPPGLGGGRSFRDQSGQAFRPPYSHEPSQSRPQRAEELHEKIYHSREMAKPGFSSLMHRSRFDDHIGQLLPSLGPIDTNQPPLPFTSHASQPPNSASSLDRAPSLVSDHNSTHSISPKTWPSPRPEALTQREATQARWKEQTHGSRRGSAPAISNLVSLPLTGDDGYVLAIPASPPTASRRKYFLPTPLLGRPASSDARHRNPYGHLASNSDVSPLPMMECGSGNGKSPSSAQDDRMKFSSLLN